MCATDWLYDSDESIQISTEKYSQELELEFQEIEEHLERKIQEYERDAKLRHGLLNSMIVSLKWKVAAFSMSLEQNKRNPN